MSTEYLSGASNYTQMNLSGRLSLELVSALRRSSAGKMTARGLETNEFPECSYADKMIIRLPLLQRYFFVVPLAADTFSNNMQWILCGGELRKRFRGDGEPSFDPSHFKAGAGNRSGLNCTFSLFSLAAVR